MKGDRRKVTVTVIETDEFGTTRIYGPTKAGLRSLSRTDEFFYGSRRDHGWQFNLPPDVDRQIVRGET